jgi:DNA polymerase-1
MANERLVLVDGSWLVFRAYFAIPANFRTASGLPTNATYGFASMFRKLLAGRKIDRGAVVFDAPGVTHREVKYAQYKAQRPPIANELRVQLEWIDKVVRAHDFPILRVEGYEADDVIGTLAKKGVEAGMDVTIVAGDKDFAQLIGPQLKMMDTMRDVTFDEELVVKKWGVKPSQIIDLLAIMGDTVDNIPGIAGIGQTGAVKLLTTFGSLKGIYERIDELKGKQKATLEEQRANAMLSYDLATIDTNVPVPFTLDDLRIPEVNAARVNALYRELEFNSLLSGEEPGGADDSGAAMPCITCSDPDRARAELDRVFAASPVAVTPLYDGLSPVHAELVGLAFSAEPGHAIYLPFRGAGATLGDAGLEIARPYLESADKAKVVHNLKALWILLRQRGVELRGVVADIMLASFLVDPNKCIPHRLDQLVREFLQRTLQPYKLLVGAGQKELPLVEIEVERTSAYACHLADAVIGVWKPLSARLESEHQVEHMHAVEMPLSFVLGQMEIDGIKVDKDDLARMGEEFATRRNEEEQAIYRLAGHEFNIGSQKQLSRVLFEELQLPVITKTKTGYSTDSEVLERLAPKHEIARHLLQHRALSKLINTYTDVLQNAVSPKTGRIHANFQQTTGVSGRLISTDPDLQRTPVRTPEGKRIRRAFVADPGRTKLISADWSQIELRVLAHFCADPLLVDSFQKNLDVHRRTASQIFHCEPEAVTSEQRSIGKTVNFATIYGQGATALGQILGIPRKEAQGYIDGYFKAYAGVRKWLDETIAQALANGYVTTILGRRRYIPELSSNSAMDKQAGQRIAANTPIQGSAADICKLAMLQITSQMKERGMQCRMLLQVHDELVFECPESEVDAACAIVRDRMEHAYPMRVPLVVDVGVGNSWGEAH